MLRAFLTCVLAVAVTVCGFSFAVGQEKTNPAPAKRTVLTYVNGEAIFADQIEEQLKKTLGAEPLDPEVLPRARAAMLEQMVNQRLVEEFLARGTVQFSVRDLDVAVQNVREQLTLQGQTFARYLAENGWTEQTYRKRLAWSVGWPRYLAAQVTDERLEKYFNEHRRQFDGTAVRASQILIKVEPAASPEKRAAALERAQAVRDLIAVEKPATTAGKLSFADAARRYSDAPSAASGGDLGFFDRRQMPEKVAQAAFDLALGEISPPLVTPYGVHLLQVTELKPGDKTWRDVRKQLEPLVIRQLFTDISTAERKTATIGLR